MITNTFELTLIGIHMSDQIQYIKEYYPELKNNNAIKKLIAISDKWDKIFSGNGNLSSREGGTRA